MKKHILFIGLLFLLPQFAFGQWTQQGSDIDGEEVNAGFGGVFTALNDNGNRLAIGVPWNSGNGGSSGHVRVYEFNGADWVQLGADIDGEAAGDLSGYSVSLSNDGNILAAGAYGNDQNGNLSGHVRIYEFNGIDWVQLGNDIDGEAAGDQSGYAVSVSADGHTLAVGARYNDGNGEDAGHVRVYQFNGADWIQLGADIDGEAAFDRFGSDVSLNANGTRVAVGANYNDGNGDNSGHVRVFEFDGMNWDQIGMDIDGEAASDESGWAVSLNAAGNIVAIGAPGNDSNLGNEGHIRIYEYNGADWIQLGSDIDGDSVDDDFGWSVSLNAAGDRVIGGAPHNHDNGINSGHVKIYEFNGADWIQTGMNIVGESSTDEFGESVSMDGSGNIIAASAPNDDEVANNTGHVRVFRDPAYTLIPDPNFEQALIDQGIDSEGILDGQVLRWDITWLGTLDVSNLGIADLTGIEDFVYLANLNCSFNQLTALDVSNNSNLRRLYCHDNQLNGNINLRDLNFLVRLNTANNPGLSCIAIDDAIAANAGTGIYTHWIKDNTTNYAVNCNVSLSRDTGFSDIKNTESNSQTEESNPHSLRVYPNPAQNRLHIALPAEETIANVVFYNLEGKQVLTSKTTRINISSLTEGLYFVAIRILEHQKTAYKKIIISKQ